MGSYEREQQMIADKTASRGETARRYFAELDARLNEETSHLSHRPDYSKTLFAPENDDIYREFCSFVDLPEPRHFDDIEDPISVDGRTAADVYFAMKSKNDRIVAIDETEVSYSTDIKSALKGHKVGDVLTIKVVREGKYVDVKVTLHEYVPTTTTTTESSSGFSDKTNGNSAKG